MLLSSHLKYSSLAVILMLSACGGGGGGGSSSGDTTGGGTGGGTTTVTVDAGAGQVVFEGTAVTLSATASNAATYAWTQTGGTDVTLSSSTVLSPTFAAPDVDGIEILTFQLTATGTAGSATDTVNVTIGSDDLPDYASVIETDSLTEDLDVVSCTLSNGSASFCLSVTLGVAPANYNIGPWCPRNINDDASAGGIWLENDTDYDVDGAFISNLSTFYNDTNWNMFDPETGAINYTETAEECDLAARPNVDPALQNHCVECQVDFVDETISATYLLPLAPELAASAATSRDGYGVAFSGVKFDAAAPVDAILGAYTIAPFDDCGGHVNPVVGYHIHAVTEADDCLAQIDNVRGHAPQIGIAFDGFPIHERKHTDGTAPDDLDNCGGHNGDSAYSIEGYHYHVNEPGANNVLGCLSGLTAN